MRTFLSLQLNFKFSNFRRVFFLNVTDVPYAMWEELDIVECEGLVVSNQKAIVGGWRQHQVAVLEFVEQSSPMESKECVGAIVTYMCSSRLSERHLWREKKMNFITGVSNVYSRYVSQ